VATQVSIVAEARYENQVWEIDVPLDRADFDGPGAVEQFRAAFDRQHELLFTVRDARSAVEIVALRANVRCRLRERAAFRLGATRSPTERGERRVVFPGHGALETPVRRLDALPESREFTGPAILESPFTTVVVDPDARYCRQPSGSLVVYP
jgi:N-methylhydantoinase A